MEMSEEDAVNESRNGGRRYRTDSEPSDAVVVREALERRDTNLKAVAEIFVGRKSSHILLMKQEYGARFATQMEQDIINVMDPPHPYQKILIALMASHKAHHVDVCRHIAKCDAMRLYESGVEKSGRVEEALVLEILSKRSIPQLKLTFSCYKHIYGHDYTKLLKKEKSGEFEDAFRTVVKCMCSPAKYYAKRLHSSIKGSETAVEGGIGTGTGTGPGPGAMAVAMASRAGVDMDEVVKMLRNKYGMNQSSQTVLF